MSLNSFSVRFTTGSKINALTTCADIIVMFETDSVGQTLISVERCLVL